MKKVERRRRPLQLSTRFDSCKVWCRFIL